MPAESFVIETMGVGGRPDPDQVKHSRAPDCKRRGWHPFAECGEREWIRAHRSTASTAEVPRA